MELSVGVEHPKYVEYGDSSPAHFNVGSSTEKEATKQDAASRPQLCVPGMLPRQASWAGNFSQGDSSTLAEAESYVAELLQQEQVSNKQGLLEEVSKGNCESDRHQNPDGFGLKEEDLKMELSAFLRGGFQKQLRDLGLRVTDQLRKDVHSMLVGELRQCVREELDRVQQHCDGKSNDRGHMISTYSMLSSKRTYTSPLLLGEVGNASFVSDDALKDPIDRQSLTERERAHTVANMFDAAVKTKTTYHGHNSLHPTDTPGPSPKHQWNSEPEFGTASASSPVAFEKTKSAGSKPSSFEKTKSAGSRLGFESHTNSVHVSTAGGSVHGLVKRHGNFVSDLELEEPGSTKGGIPLFHPLGAFMKMWRPLTFGAVFFVVAMAPFDVAWSWWNPPDAYKVFFYLLDVVFICDMFLQFNIAFFFHGQLVTNRRQISLHYMRTFFIPDLVSNIPFDLFFGSGGKGRKITKLLKLPKILRAVKAVGTLKDHAEYLGVTTSICAIWLLAHYYSCFWAVSMAGDCETSNTCPDVGSSYLEALGISMSGLTGTDAWMRFVGPDVSVLAAARGSRTPPPHEDLVSALMTVAGFALLACLFASVASSLRQFTDVGRHHFKMVEVRKQEMERESVPYELQEKVLATYERIWRYRGQDPNKGVIQDKALCLDLRREVAFWIYGKALQGVPLFKDISDASIKCLAQRVELRYFNPGDLLLMYGEVGRELFIIQEGSVRPLDKNGDPLGDRVLGKGAYVGENCFLRPGARRNASIVCLDFCKTLSLTLDTVRDLNLYDVFQGLSRDTLQSSLETPADTKPLSTLDVDLSPMSGK